ncbi:MAG: hypothetical protein WDM84_04215 [Bauldia sp.]
MKPLKRSEKVSDRADGRRPNLTLRTGASRFLDAVGWPRRVLVARDDAGLLWASDWSSRLAIVAPERARLYWRGVQRRSLRLCLHHYLGDGRVPVRPGDVVINVGANIGEVATCLAGRGARVIAIDLTPPPAAVSSPTLRAPASKCCLSPHGRRRDR